MQEQTKRSAAQWSELIDAYEAGDQTQVEFAEANGVRGSTFIYWRQKLRKRRGSGAETGAVAPFVELRSSTAAAAAAAITIRLDVASVTFSGLPDPEYLAAVLAGLAR
jgi:transposase-like protein